MKHISLPSSFLLFTVILSAPLLYAMPPVVEAGGVVEAGSVVKAKASIPAYEENNSFNENEEETCHFYGTGQLYGLVCNENGDLVDGDSEKNHSEEKLQNFYALRTSLYDQRLEEKKQNGVPQERKEKLLESDQERFEGMVLNLRKKIQIREFLQEKETLQQGEEASYKDIFQEEETIQEIKTLDAITLLNEIASDRKIIFPFNAPGLQNYSLQDLLRDISKNISYEITEIHKIIDDVSSGVLNESEPALQQNIIKYLQLQEEAWVKGGTILSRISQERDNQQIIDFFDQSLVYLSKSFSLYQYTAQAAGARRFDEAQSLATQALGYLSFANEENLTSSIENSSDGFITAFDLLEKSKEALAKGEEETAHRLTLQAEVLLSELQEELGDARENIIKNYQTSWDLIEKAEKALAGGLLQWSDPKKAIYLVNESKALYYMTYEAAAREPREDITEGYAESASFFEQALKIKKLLESDLAESFNGQGLALLQLTREKAGLNRSEIIEGYQESLTLFKSNKKYVSQRYWDPLLTQYYNNGGQVLLGFTEEKARPDGPRKSIMDLYENAYSTFEAVILLYAADEKNPLVQEYNQGVVNLLQKIDCKKRELKNKKMESF